MRVFLTGATGFVGSHILRKLVCDGHDVVALVRDASLGRKLSADLGQSAQTISGDVVTGKGLGAGLRGCDAVIHLVGIIVETVRATFEKVHHQGTRNVVEAAKANGIRRFVHMSALGASATGVSGYQTSKWNAEEDVRRSGIPYVILRPSITFGPGDGFVSQMCDVMMSSPLVRPVPGTGKYPFQPIWIENVVDCFVQALQSDKATNTTTELGGPEVLTLDELLQTIAAVLGVKKPSIHIPFPLMYLNAMILQKLLKKPPVTTDQLNMLRQGSTCDTHRMLEVFDTELIKFRDGLETYLDIGHNHFE